MNPSYNIKRINITYHCALYRDRFNIGFVLALFPAMISKINDTFAIFGMDIFKKLI